MLIEQFSYLVQNPDFDPIEANTSRFSQAAWFDFVRNQEILVGGAGGIGSWLCFMLSRLGPKRIWLFDDDVVDASNLGGQLFNENDIGEDKVLAVEHIVRQFSRYYNLNTVGERIDENSDILPIVFGGFDNMEARRTLYNVWKKKVNDPSFNPDTKTLFIDGRLSAEVAQVFCFTKDDDYYMKEYEENWLFADEEAESVVCSYKQTSYCANLIASLMTNLFVNWCTNQCNPLVPRTLPFMTEYTAEFMHLKTTV